MEGVRGSIPLVPTIPPLPLHSLRQSAAIGPLMPIPHYLNFSPLQFVGLGHGSLLTGRPPANSFPELFQRLMVCAVQAGVPALDMLGIPPGSLHEWSSP